MIWMISLGLKRLTTKQPKEYILANSKRMCKYHGKRIRKYIIVNNMAFCSFEFAAKWGNENKIIGKKKNQKSFNRETKRLKETIKKRTGKNGFYDNLKTQLHKYIKHVLRKGEPCYTCDKPQRYEDSGQAFHVGHFIPQKQVDPRRFMLMNLRIQCYKCNTHNSGMRAEYRQRLIQEIGINQVEWLECEVNHKSLKEQYPEISDIKTETTRYRKLLRDNGIVPNN